MLYSMSAYSGRQAGCGAEPAVCPEHCPEKSPGDEAGALSAPPRLGASKMDVMDVFATPTRLHPLIVYRWRSGDL